MSYRRQPLVMADVAALEAIYARLPKLDCKKLCQVYCGAIDMSKLEFTRLANRMGRVPRTIRANEHCPLLGKDGNCKTHDIRPMLCRLFGMVDNDLMRCPHGCKPERWITSEEGHKLLDEVFMIGRTPCPVDGSETLPLENGISTLEGRTSTDPAAESSSTTRPNSNPNPPVS